MSSSGLEALRSQLPRNTMSGIGQEKKVDMRAEMYRQTDCSIINLFATNIIIFEN